MCAKLPGALYTANCCKLNMTVPVWVEQFTSQKNSKKILKWDYIIFVHNGGAVP